jgi:hypothetical protein
MDTLGEEHIFFISLHGNFFINGLLFTTFRVEGLGLGVNKWIT